MNFCQYFLYDAILRILPDYAIVSTMNNDTLNDMDTI